MPHTVAPLESNSKATRKSSVCHLPSLTLDPRRCRPRDWMPAIGCPHLDRQWQAATPREALEGPGNPPDLSIRSDLRFRTTLARECHRDRPQTPKHRRHFGRTQSRHSTGLGQPNSVMEWFDDVECSFSVPQGIATGTYTTVRVSNGMVASIWSIWSRWSRLMA